MLWLPASTSLPIRVSPYLDGDALAIDFISYDYTYRMTAHPASCVVSSQNSPCGVIQWDIPKARALASTLKGLDPQPWSDTFVHPTACVVIGECPLQEIVINNNPFDGEHLQISCDESKHLRIDKETSSINMYALEDLSEDTPIHKITVVGTNGDSLNTIDGLIGDVWLRSDALSDIRVISNTGILISEVTNDNI